LFALLCAVFLVNGPGALALSNKKEMKKRNLAVLLLSVLFLATYIQGNGQKIGHPSPLGEEKGLPDGSQG
jgi:apolipoprotein N-acyltransferase